MTARSHHRSLGPVMWAAIGITFLVLALVATFGLDPSIARYAVGALLLVCLAVCGAAFWLDTRADRSISRFDAQNRWGVHR